MRTALRSIVLLAAACGSSASAPADAPLQPVADAPSVIPDAAVVDGRLADAGAVLLVPDPGTGSIPNFWPDREPNDTPEQAVPLGVGGAVIGPYVDDGSFRGGHLGADDPADWFVFRAPADGPSHFLAVACWYPPVEANLLDFALYQVIDGQPLIPVASSSSTGKFCEQPEPFWDILLEPGAKYLFGLTRVEGEGFYQA